MAQHSCVCPRHKAAPAYSGMAARAKESLLYIDLWRRNARTKGSPLRPAYMRMHTLIGTHSARIECCIIFAATRTCYPLLQKSPSDVKKQPLLFPRLRVPLNHPPKDFLQGGLAEPKVQ